MGLPQEMSNQQEINEFLHARLTVLERILSELYPDSFSLDFDNISDAEIQSSGLNSSSKARLTTEALKHKAKYSKNK